MLWFRKHRRHGSWLAFVALAINFALAFGHVHAPDRAVGSERQVIADSSPGTGQSEEHPADHHADYLCPICVAAGAMANAIAPTPPSPSVKFACSKINHIIDYGHLVPRPTHTAFLSRGPPTS